MAEESLGVDMGGVIMSRIPEEGIYLPLPDVFEVLRRLKEEWFGDSIFVVSRADEDMEDFMRGWLMQEGFFHKTGIACKSIRFCRQRSDKVSHCQALGITHFIDDRTEVLGYLREAGIPNLYLFQGREDEMATRQQLLAHVTQVASWQEVAKHFLI